MIKITQARIAPVVPVIKGLIGTAKEVRLRIRLITPKGVPTFEGFKFEIL
jgi:hypothetical protein